MKNKKNEKQKAAVLFLLLCFSLLMNGCNMFTSRQKQEQKEMTEEITTEEITTEERIITESNYDALSNQQYAWWFERNNLHQPSGCQKDFDITPYNAYYLVPTTEQKIYLTFDCGYENGFTSGILDVLKRNEATATFFVTQTFIRDNIELVKRMKEEGHLVGNHTITHPSMPSQSIDKLKQEILGCEEYMKEATGYEMDLFFRPPRGEYSIRTLQLTKDLGYTTVFWSMTLLDFDIHNQPAPAHVVEHYGKYHHPGAVPLLHNVSSANAHALEDIIKNLKSEGYSFNGLTDLKNN